MVFSIVCHNKIKEVELTKLGPKKFLKIKDYENVMILEGCFHFSFLIFCLFLIIVYFKKFFW